MARLAGFHSLVAVGILASFCLVLFAVPPTAGYVVSLQAPAPDVQAWAAGPGQAQPLVFRSEPDASWREVRCSHLAGGLAEVPAASATAHRARPELELDCLVTYAGIRQAIGPDSADWFSTLQRGPGYGLRSTKPVFWPEDLAAYAAYALLVHAVLALAMAIAWRSGARRALLGWRDAVWSSLSNGWLLVPVLTCAVLALLLSGLGFSPGPPLPALQGWPLATFVFAALLVAPWVEEFFFRGWMMDSLGQCVPARVAMLVSANAFALMHLPNSPVIWSYYLAVGLSLGWLRARSVSLVPGVLAHSLLNLLALMPMLFLA